MGTKPVPTPNADTAPFWEGVKAEKLVYQWCQVCDRAQFYPRALCTRCRVPNLEWRTSQGLGTIYSYTEVERPPTPAFEAPYFVALVDFDEGFRMMVNVRNGSPGQVRIGLPVRVVFEDCGEEGLKLPQVEPVLAQAR